jgi:hypothetical protein
MVADTWAAVSMVLPPSMAERPALSEADAEGSSADLVADHGSMAVRHTNTRSVFALTGTTKIKGPT